MGWVGLKAHRKWTDSTCQWCLCMPTSKLTVNMLIYSVKRAHLLSSHPWLHPSFLPSTYLYSVDNALLVSLILICRILIYSVDSAIQHLNNRDQSIKTVLKLIDKVKTNENYFITQNISGIYLTWARALCLFKSAQHLGLVLTKKPIIYFIFLHHLSHQMLRGIFSQPALLILIISTWKEFYIKIILLESFCCQLWFIVTFAV